MTRESKVERLLKGIPEECQRMAKELASRLLNVDAYLRLSVERGVGKTGIGEWASSGEVETHTAGYIETQTVMSALEASLKRLKYRAGTVTLAQINQSSSIKVMVRKEPPVSPYFVRREKEWEKLVWYLVTTPSSRQRIMPITGMGGCGKTQSVSFFILQEYASLQAVFVDASSPANIEADLQAWAGELGDGHEHDVWEDAIRILGMVPESERWALVLDNADDPTLNLGPLYPNICNNLTVIITSRNRNLGNLSTSHHVELREMEPEEAVTTLLSSALREAGLLPEELESANTLLKGIVEALHTGSQSFEMNSGGFRVSRSSRYDRQWEFW